MEVEERPPVSYSDVGGLELQIRELKEALTLSEQSQTRNQFKSAAIQLATNFKQGREVNVIAGLILVCIAATINDVSLLPKAKQLGKVGGGE